MQTAKCIAFQSKFHLIASANTGARHMKSFIHVQHLRYFFTEVMTIKMSLYLLKLWLCLLLNPFT